jgi:molybdopterin-guanine dinucleotide biosynthesis protein A
MRLSGPTPGFHGYVEEVPDTPTWTAIVLSGGRSSRLGHDKSRVRIDGRMLIDLVVDAIPPSVPCIIVGPDPGPLTRTVIVTREDPPGAGPVAGIAAGLACVTTDLVAVIAVDMPFAGAELAGLIEEFATSAAVDAVIPLDADGRRQPLAGVYATPALRAAVEALETPIGASVRSLIAHLTIKDLPVPSPLTLLDVDTPADLAAARRSVRSGERGDDVMEDRSMDDWVAAVTSALGIEQDVDIDLILDVARDAAHGVARPAAPVTTFLLGCAVAGGMSAKDAAERVTALAKEWPAGE